MCLNIGYFLDIDIWYLNYTLFLVFSCLICARYRKFKIIDTTDENEKVLAVKKLVDIAEELKMKQYIISTNMKGRQAIESRGFLGSFSNSAKWFPAPDEFSEINNCFFQCFKTCRFTNIAFSDEILKTKAQFF